MFKRSDHLQVGEEYQPLVLTVTRELNNRFQEALDDCHPRYQEIVHPGVFLAYASITKSPSFSLPDRVQAVGAKMELECSNPGLIGATYTINWKVSEVYEKRSRIYQISDVTIRDDSGTEIMRRKINNTFIGGEHLERRVKWEQETNYRHRDSPANPPQAGYEIVGKPKELTMKEMRLFSGGPPGPDWPARNIHTFREVAIRSGIGKPIASGLMFEAYMIEFMLDIFGENWLNTGKAKVVFIEMAGEGDTLLPKAVIKSKYIHGSNAEINLELWCENQYGNKLMVGSGKGVWTNTD